MRRGGLVLAGALALAGCADMSDRAPTPPLNLGPDAWRVTAPARPGADPRMDVLREAAGLTLAQGGDWFRVVERRTPRTYEDQDSMFSFQSPVDETGLVRMLDIVVGRGAKPPGMDVYDAREVAARLGPARSPPPAPPRPRDPRGRVDA